MQSSFVPSQKRTEARRGESANGSLLRHVTRRVRWKIDSPEAHVPARASLSWWRSRARASPSSPFIFRIARRSDDVYGAKLASLKKLQADASSVIDPAPRGRESVDGRGSWVKLCPALVAASNLELGGGLGEQTERSSIRSAIFHAGSLCISLMIQVATTLPCFQ